MHRNKPQLGLSSHQINGKTPPLPLQDVTKSIIIISEDVAIKTPVRTSNPRSEDEDSPYFPCSTQELREDVDVLWDYNLPERKKGRVVRKSKKRLNLQQSPKVPLRRHPSNNNQIKQDFCKLREELRALKAEIAKPPEHEDSLILSPREEASFKAGNLSQAIEELVTEEEDSIEDPFDDGMDDQLILFSQQVEEEIEKAYKGLDSDSTRLKCDKMVASKAKQAIKSVQDSDIFNDSLDNLITEMSEDVFDQLTQVADLKQCKQAQSIKNSSKNNFPRSVSENCVKFETAKTVTNKVEWHRTQSFENYSKGKCDFVVFR